jgi:DNA mismatch repair protein MutL
MGNIKLLSKQIIQKIAAGEVIERPASVVKELIENALDAKATSISVEVENSGLKKIIVTDDGQGMDAEDLVQSVERYTTSKLSSLDDLLTIRSLGFRGEALYSIAAMSSLCIESRIASAAYGNGIKVQAGLPTQQFSLGMPPGTRVTVERLFSKHPARKNFLAQPQQELRAIGNVVTRAALAAPHVRFSLSHNGKLLFTTPSNQNLKERLKFVLGEDVFEQLVPIFLEAPHSTIHGFVGKPSLASNTPTHQYVCINNRPVHERVVIAAIRNAYKAHLPSRLHPPFVLFLELHPSTIDLHTHPRKETVRLLNQTELEEALSSTISHALVGNTFPKPISERDTIVMDRGMEDYLGNALKNLHVPWHPSALPEDEILQVDNVYLISHTTDSIFVIDQHAAHERILYEEFLEAYKKTEARHARHPLPEAKIVELPLPEYLQFEENLDTLRSVGFDIEPFGGRSVKLAAVPTLLKERDSMSVLLAFLKDLEDTSMFTALDEKTERTISYLACRGSIKAGDPLNQHERKNLLEKLLEHPSYITCPHGRPTKIEFSRSDLNRMFKRK